MIYPIKTKISFNDLYVFQSQDSKSPVGTSSPVPASFQVPTEPGEMPSKTVKPPALISLANIMKSQGATYSLQKAAESSIAKPPIDVASKDNNQANNEVSDKDKQPVDKGDDSDVIVLSDSSLDSPMKKNEEKIKPASPALNTSAPTVKIKMGLLQAVKKLKPNKNEGAANSGDNETSQDEGLSSALSDDESEAPIPSASDDQEAKANSTTSSSSSSSSSSESESSSDDDSGGEGDDDEKSEGSDDEESGSDDSESDNDDDNDDEEDNTDKSNNKNTINVSDCKTQSVKRTLKVVTTTEDEEESSDNDDEIDLISSNDEGDDDDDKDKDYNVSEDDIDNDVIMISDDEYAPKGRAVIPSPPHTNVSKGTEVLVKEVPDFDPSLISGLMSDIDPGPVEQPVVNKTTASFGQSAMEVDKS